MRVLTAALFLIASFGPGRAALSASSSFDLNYGGRLADVNGVGIIGPVDIEVNFFRTATGGISLVATPLLFSKVALEDGVFDLTLANSDVSALVDPSLGATWIEVRDATHNVTYPRQILGAAPFALRIPVDGNTLQFNSLGQLYAPSNNNSAPPAPTGVTSITTSTGLSGGPITTSGSIYLANTAVTPGSYMCANVTVDAQGRLTSASNGSTSLAGSNVSGLLGIVNGGTGASSAANARSALSAAASGVNADITSLTGLNVPLSVTQGGSGLTAIPANGQILIGNGTGYTLGSITGGAGITITNTPAGIGIAAADSGVSSLAATPPLAIASNSLSLPQATTSSNGYLSSTDWQTFNSKQAMLSTIVGNVGVGTTSPVALLDVHGSANINSWASQRLSANGYARMGGILLQWGTSGYPNNAGANITFPVAFTNLFSITATVDAGADTGSGSNVPCKVMGSSTTGFTFAGITAFSGDSTSQVRWMAIGI